MTRRHWFGTVFATVFGAWGAARARAVARSPMPLPDPHSAAAAGCRTFYYDAANPVDLDWVDSGTVTTYVYYAAGPGRPV